MTEQRILPEKVTKPIQLLAAWLVGLILVDASFLLGAQQITRPEWASALLVISAVANVPVFIGALFLLQTKFRPQMQEDSYYSQYLEREKSFTVTQQDTAAEVIEKEVVVTADKIVKSLGSAAKGKEQPIANILRESQQEVLVAKYGKSRTLSELYKSPDTWDALVDKWGKHSVFIKEVEGMLEDGLLEKKYKGYRRCKLTQSGISVAQDAEKAGVLFSQRHKHFWEKQRVDLMEGDA